MDCALAFAVATVAAIASMLRSVLAAVGCSLGVLLGVLPGLAAVDSIRSWTPQALAQSADPLLSGKEGLDAYVLPAVVAVCLTVALLAVAIGRVRIPASSDGARPSPSRRRSVQRTGKPKE
ncbi:hypothetical protein [Streptomyces sp. ERV7]|uniref:hypothetical protein n=1 Tax=Streptomyces sp. ERV7 TaxID=1322334 RepID=UPI00131C35CD|nr:hypothetical protein [Streptomyces sp. ERV7]